ncbi:hypothetical protein QCA50_009150 [Cerrena zonata]|uniref:Uncharacterized protein n=1 Tax=Cerrena zonata TaxID=2478898 RepID=A0AAW0GEC6_9APHY
MPCAHVWKKVSRCPSTHNPKSPQIYSYLGLHDRSDEVVTPHQTTLLMLLDYFHTQPQRISEPWTPSRKEGPHQAVCQENFHSRGIHPVAICRSLGIEQIDTRTSPTKEVPQSLKDRAFSATPYGEEDLSRPIPVEELDLVLPKVCEALVLVAQCITSMTLRAEEEHKNDKEAESLTINHSADLGSLKMYVTNTHSSTDTGLVESLLGNYHFPRLS